MIIIAVDKKTGEEEIVEDLYWFEENFVRQFKDDFNYTFKFQIESGDIIKADSKDKLNLVALDKNGLQTLVRGTCPYYTAFNHPLIARAGYYMGGFNERWQWNDLSKFTEEELLEIYRVCKESFK